jgi:hypothetical protein
MPLKVASEKFGLLTSSRLFGWEAVWNCNCSLADEVRFTLVSNCTLLLRYFGNEAETNPTTRKAMMCSKLNVLLFTL